MGTETLKNPIAFTNIPTDVYPKTDDTYWLGTSTKGWKGLHMADSMITDESGYAKLRNNADDAYVGLKCGDFFTDRWLEVDANTFIGVGVAGAGNLSHSAGNEGYFNTSVGRHTLYEITTGEGNTAIGQRAMYKCTEGEYNTAVGEGAGWNITTASYNVAIGTGALYTNQTGNGNVAIGKQPLYVCTGGGNVAIGYEVGLAITDASGNTLMGFQTGKTLTSGGLNTAIGNSALYTNSTGTQNVALGYKAGYYETGSSKLFIDNTPRSSEVDGRVKSLVYGIFSSTTAAQVFSVNANLGIGISNFGTSADFVLGIKSGTAPTTAPANMSQMWVEDVNGAGGYAGIHKKTETTNLTEIVPGVVIKTDTGDTANPYEGLIEINTFDNEVKMYADSGWRTMASGW